MSRVGTGASPAGRPALPDLSGPWSGRDVADVAHHLRRSLDPVLQAARRSSRPDRDTVETVLRRALALGTDADLPGLAAAYRRGEATSSDLYRSPAFGAAMTDRYAEALHGR